MNIRDTNHFSLLQSHSGYDQKNKVCPVVAVTGNISQVHCDEFLPFVCVRRPGKSHSIS